MGKQKDLWEKQKEAIEENINNPQPLPARDKVSITLTKEQMAKVHELLSDMLGKDVNQEEINIIS